MFKVQLERKSTCTNEALLWWWSNTAPNGWSEYSAVMPWSTTSLWQWWQAYSITSNHDWREALGCCQESVEGIDKLPVRDEHWERGGAVYLSVSEFEAAPILPSCLDLLHHLHRVCWSKPGVVLRSRRYIPRRCKPVLLPPLPLCNGRRLY